jgi:hypothetical protein
MTDLSLFQLTSAPARPFIQEGRGQKRLSVDFSIQSQDSNEWTLRRVELAVYDVNDQLILKRRLDDQAASPSIETMPGRTLPAQGTLYFFNPYPLFDPQLDLHRLQYTFRLTAATEQSIALTAAVWPQSYRQQVKLTLPLQGRIWVDDGNDYYSHHRRLPLNHPVIQDIGLKTNTQRYAWDFMLVDEKGSVYQPDDSELEHYLVFDAPIYAPAEGVIVASRHEVKDNEPWVPGQSMAEIISDPILMMGNYLLIDHGANEYSLLGHCREGSLLVKPGERVKGGQLIARVGNSGWSAYPHLHYQLTDSPEFLTGEGLPARFAAFQLLVGAHTVSIEDGYPDTGEILL